LLFLMGCPFLLLGSVNLECPFIISKEYNTFS